MPRNIAEGASTFDRSPEILISVAAPLPQDALLEVLRNGAVVGTATSVTATTFKFTDAAPIGTHVYTAKVSVGNRQTSSPAYSVQVLPFPTATVTAVLAAEPLPDLQVILSTAPPISGDVRWIISIANIGLAANASSWPISWSTSGNYVQTSSDLPTNIVLAPGASAVYYSEGTYTGLPRGGNATVEIVPVAGQIDANLDNNYMSRQSPTIVASDVSIATSFHNNTAAAGSVDGMYKSAYSTGTISGYTISNNSPVARRFDLNAMTLAGPAFNDLGTVINGGGCDVPVGARVWNGAFEFTVADITAARLADSPIGGVNVYGTGSMSVELPAFTEFKNWQYNNLPWTEPALGNSSATASIATAPYFVDSNLANNTNTVPGPTIGF